MEVRFGQASLPGDGWETVAVTIQPEKEDKCDGFSEQYDVSTSEKNLLDFPDLSFLFFRLASWRMLRNQCELELLSGKQW